MKKNILYHIVYILAIISLSGYFIRQEYLHRLSVAYRSKTLQHVTEYLSKSSSAFSVKIEKDFSAYPDDYACKANKASLRADSLKNVLVAWSDSFHNTPNFRVWNTVLYQCDLFKAAVDSCEQIEPIFQDTLPELLYDHSEIQQKFHQWSSEESKSIANQRINSLLNRLILWQSKVVQKTSINEHLLNAQVPVLSVGKPARVGQELKATIFVGNYTTMRDTLCSVDVNGEKYKLTNGITPYSAPCLTAGKKKIMVKIEEFNPLSGAVYTRKKDFEIEIFRN